MIKLDHNSNAQSWGLKIDKENNKISIRGEITKEEFSEITSMFLKSPAYKNYTLYCGWLCTISYRIIKEDDSSINIIPSVSNEIKLV